MCHNRLTELAEFFVIFKFIKSVESNMSELIGEVL